MPAEMPFSVPSLSVAVLDRLAGALGFRTGIVGALGWGLFFQRQGLRVQGVF